MQAPVKNIMAVFLLSVGLMACSNKSWNEKTARGAGSAVPTAHGGSCSTAGRAVGRVYDGGAPGVTATFEQRVKGLLAATINPQYFGTISGSAQGGQQGVALEGRLRYETSTGAVTLDQSHLTLTIYDSYVGQRDEAGEIIEPYVIKFSAVSAGSVNVSTNEFNLKFQDQYGEVQLVGTITSSVVTGTISYQNIKNYDGSPGTGGTLGAFTIATCGWLY